MVQSIIAAEVGYHELALRYFQQALFVDLADLHGNTTDGVHVASTGGVWNALVYGFGGMRDYNGVLTFDPRLPEAWERLTFRITLQGTRIRVDLSAGEIAFTVVEGTPPSCRYAAIRSASRPRPRSGSRCPTKGPRSPVRCGRRPPTAGRTAP